MTSAAKKVSLPVTTTRWDYRKWGTLASPIHKSMMSSLVGEHACLEQFRRDRLAELLHIEREACSGRTETGTAAHESIARALRTPALRDSILAGKPATNIERVRGVVQSEFARTVAGREVRWYGKAEEEKSLEEAAQMVFGLFQDMHRHVATVELVEAGFIVKLGDLWLEGHIDLVYRPRAMPEGLAFADWKTGQTKPHQISLDHGYESGFYAHALAEGTFLPTTVLDAWRQAAAEDRLDEIPLPLPDAVLLRECKSERAAMHIGLRAVARALEQDGVLVPGAVRFERFPDEIRLVHLRDYIPYAKAGDKAVERPEDIAHWSRELGRELRAGDKVKYVAGQLRGGAWLEVKRREGDVVRLERMLRAVVSWIRFGRFVAAVGEKCTRCSYKTECLASGYELRGDDAKEMRDALKGLDLQTTEALND